MSYGPKYALTFEVEGQNVRCWGSAGSRLWYCGCDEFAGRVNRFGEGFCAHTAVVMMRQSIGGDRTDDDLRTTT